MSIKRIGILVGGGPAPGTNGVISAVAIEAIRVGYVPIGFTDGFDWLAQRYTDEQHELTIDEVSRAHLAGGVMLGASRTDVGADPALLRNTVDALRKLAVDGLVAIGGDDMVRSAIAIERESMGRIKVVMVPKSIDNDLAVPHQVTTLGHETARHVGVQLVKNRWRRAPPAAGTGVTTAATGHLTLARQAATPLHGHPEEFAPGRQWPIADIVGSIIKRRALGRVAWRCSASADGAVRPAEVEAPDVDRDARGNIRVTEIDLDARWSTR
jgi:6-phosphofructokinase 1